MQVTERLALMPYAQAEILRYNGSIALRSYSRIVCGINNKGQIWCNGLYSRTTIRHISAFARQFGYDYQDFKNALNNR